jgi:hypothetical protein
MFTTAQVIQNSAESVEHKPIILRWSYSSSLEEGQLAERVGVGAPVYLAAVICNDF